jgi:hypothetical protein
MHVELTPAEAPSQATSAPYGGSPPVEPDDLAVEHLVGVVDEHADGTLPPFGPLPFYYGQRDPAPSPRIVEDGLVGHLGAGGLQCTLARVQIALPAGM